jgi:hypothetical protein
VRQACRLRWPIASLAATSALVLAGCGGSSQPALHQADAQRLIALANRVEAAGGSCAKQHAIAQVQAEATRLVNGRRVPVRLQETLMSGVNALVDDQPTCLPDVPVSTTTHAKPTPPPAKPEKPKQTPQAGWPRMHHGPGPGEHGHGHGHGHGHHGDEQ